MSEVEVCMYERKVVSCLFLNDVVVKTRRKSNSQNVVKMSTKCLEAILAAYFEFQCFDHCLIMSRVVKLSSQTLTGTFKLLLREAL